MDGFKSRMERKEKRISEHEGHEKLFNLNNRQKIRKKKMNRASETANVVSKLYCTP